MAVEIFMPKMTDHMESGDIVAWLAQEGDRVEAGQAILEIMTDKVVAELEAPASGILKGIRPGVVENATVPVGTTLAFVASPDEVVPALSPLEPVEPVQPAKARLAVRSPEFGPAGEAPSAGDQAGPVRATPVARRLAKETGVDLRHVRGSGPGGRIREEDVRAAAEVPGISVPSGELVELTPIQRRTGARMLESIRDAPQFALSVDVDATELLRLRDSLSEGSSGVPGTRLSVTALLVKAVALTLKAHPRVNASLQDGRVMLHPEANIGVAVGGEDGLVVPVIRWADEKSLPEINSELRGFENRAAMRFGPEELSGGTFTISNLGMFGVDRFNAIVNPPESAILAVGRIVRRPVGLADETVALRPMMSLTLTIDHRVLDGLQAARFLADLRERIEKPYTRADERGE